MADHIELVAIDHGYDSIKAYNSKQLISFKSKYEETADSINKGSTYHIKYGTDEYIVGDGASIQYIEYDKTANDYNKIFTLAVLGKLLGTKEYGNFNIVTGYPLNLYIANKNIFSKYLKTNDVIEFYFNGQKKRIKNNHCLVFPQGVSSAFVNPSQYQNKLVAILDVGGITVNGCILNNLNLNTNTTFTINQGCIILFNKLKKVLNSYYTLNIQEYEIPNIIKNGLIVNGEKTKAGRLIDNVIFEHCNIIKAECRKFNWNVETLEMNMVGGGAYILDGYIQTIIPQIQIVHDPVFSNVKGLYEIGRHYYAKNN